MKDSMFFIKFLQMCLIQIRAVLARADKQDKKPVPVLLEENNWLNLALTMKEYHEFKTGTEYVADLSKTSLLVKGGPTNKYEQQSRQININLMKRMVKQQACSSYKTKVCHPTTKKTKAQKRKDKAKRESNKPQVETRETCNEKKPKSMSPEDIKECFMQAQKLLSTMMAAQPDPAQKPNAAPETLKKPLFDHSMLSKGEIRKILMNDLQNIQKICKETGK